MLYVKFVVEINCKKNAIRGTHICIWGWGGGQLGVVKDHTFIMG